MASGAGAAVTACAAAALLGTASVAQRRAALGVSDRRAGDPRLVAALVRRGWWWAGLAASLGGLALQFFALASGSIILVQSLMTSSIVWSVLMEWALAGCRPPPRAWRGIALTVTGLVVVLLALSPTAPLTGSGPSGGATLLLAAGCAAVMATVVATPGRGADSNGLAAALATGLGYGVTAVCLKSVGAQLSAGWLEPLSHPALYVAVALGPFSILLSQNALQQARVIGTVMTVILVVDPVVGLVTGVAWFGETIATHVVSLIVAAVGALTLAAGMVTTLGATAGAASGRVRPAP